MNTYMRQTLLVAVAILGLGMVGTKVEAANPDTMTVSVTPNVTFGVTITSVNASGYQFGTVNLGATTQSTAAVILTNSGNIAEYFSMAISNTSGGWSAVSGAPGTDEFRMTALLNAGTQPALASITDALVNPPVPGAAATLYGQASTKTAPSGTKNLWMKLEMPSGLNTGTTAAQTMTLTVNGQGS